MALHWWLPVACCLILLMGANKGPPFYTTSLIQAIDCSLLGHELGDRQYAETHGGQLPIGPAGPVHPAAAAADKSSKQEFKQQLNLKPQSARWSVPNDVLSQYEASEARNNNEIFVASTIDNQVIRGQRQGSAEVEGHHYHHRGDGSGDQTSSWADKRTSGAAAGGGGANHHHHRNHHRRRSRRNHEPNKLADISRPDHKQQQQQQQSETNTGQTGGEITHNRGGKSESDETNPLIEFSNSESDSHKLDNYAGGPILAGAKAQRWQLGGDDDEQANSDNNNQLDVGHKNTGSLESEAPFPNGAGDDDDGSPPLGPIQGSVVASPPIDRFSNNDNRQLARPHKVQHNDGHDGGGGGGGGFMRDWCHMSCSNHERHHHHSVGINNNGSREMVVCASNGRLYKSMCELRRQACLDNVHLFKRPISECASSFPSPTSQVEPQRTLDTNKHNNRHHHHQNHRHHRRQQQQQQQQQRASGNLTESDGPELAEARVSSEASNNLKQDDKVRFIQLKGHCGRAQLDGLKLALLRQFNGQIDSLFRYLDTNHDGLIGARELWPRHSNVGDDDDGYKDGVNEPSNDAIHGAKISHRGKQLLWENESSDCRNQSPKTMLHYHSDKSSGCWYFLDFPFEPYHEGNPCSLSHLMLFDLDHPNDSFDYNSFYRSITNLKTAAEEAGNDTHSASKQTEQLLKTTQLTLRLGESKSLDCLPPDWSIDDLNTNNTDDDDEIGAANMIEDRVKLLEAISQAGMANRCYWSRYSKPLATIQDAHISIGPRTEANGNRTEINKSSLALHVKAAQLYLSGHFKCTCQLENPSLKSLVHQYEIQVIAEPKVTVRPGYQWSLPGSRIQFECQHDFIDTRLKEQAKNQSSDDVSTKKDSGTNLFDLQINWLKTNANQASSQDIRSSNEQQDVPSTNDEVDNWAAMDVPINNGTNGADGELLRLKSDQARISISMASTKLAMESLQQNDTADYVCRVEVPMAEYGVISAEGRGSLLVQEQPESYQQQRASEVGTHLWVFHDNGISVFRLQNDDGQELELLREINGHSLVSPEVDGNWNQLTLCGGLNQEQVVICEWSDNALHFNVEKPNDDDDVRRMGSERFKNMINNSKNRKRAKVQKYIYVGQPNLNRVIVMDGIRFEIVAIINTEPQPRKLFPARPNKIHLNKWVRRRLSPVANARWLNAIGRHAHDLQLTPESQLYSQLKARTSQQRVARHAQLDPKKQDHLMPSKLIQHDIWLLCYGQPMVVSPAGDDQTRSDEQNSSLRSTMNGAPGLYNGPMRDSVQPFTPHLPIPGNSVPLAWSIALQGGTVNAREAKLRNRKSVQIIQTTFFPNFLHSDDDDQHQHHHDDGDEGQEAAHDDYRQRYSADPSSVTKFKRLTVLTTHYVFTGITVQNGGLNRSSRQRYLNQPRFDLIQDLSVPVKPYPLKDEPKYNMHYTYVTHYDEQRLYRVSMDAYRYDREIDLQNCDPINLVSTAQGLLIIQCRAPITHDLVGQLILDELTSSEIEFNPNICAQEMYLSPDNRYLVSIYTNTTSASNGVDELHKSRFVATNQQQSKRQSIIYVQSISVEGLKLQYEIKTSLEISRCSFVWKDGYYAAIFVSTNHDEQQSEVLSLRLADGRLELIVRVAGVVNASRHKEALNVLPELQLAALSTNKGTYVIDLEENRVTQTLNHHQSIPTLLWV